MEIENECTLNKDSFIMLKPFMVTELNLSGNTLIIFAAIYGVTITKGLFYGSLEYLGLFKKRRTQKGCIYVSTYKEKKDTDVYESEESSHEESSHEESSHEKSSLSNVKKLHIGSEKSSHNNIVNILDDNININLSAESGKEKKVSSETKQQEQESFLNSISETDRNNSYALVEYMLESFRQTYPRYNRRKSVLIDWQYTFATFLISNQLDFNEVKSTLEYALDSEFWSACIFKPTNFIKNYEKILRQSVLKNRQPKNTEHVDLSDKISLGELAFCDDDHYENDYDMSKLAVKTEDDIDF